MTLKTVWKKATLLKVASVCVAIDGSYALLLFVARPSIHPALLFAISVIVGMAAWFIAIAVHGLPWDFKIR